MGRKDMGLVLRKGAVVAEKRGFVAGMAELCSWPGYLHFLTRPRLGIFTCTHRGVIPENNETGRRQAPDFFCRPAKITWSRYGYLQKSYDISSRILYVTWLRTFCTSPKSSNPRISPFFTSASFCSKPVRSLSSSARPLRSN